MTIVLNELINQIRHELLTPEQSGTSDATYPFLFVEEVEVEIGITVSREIEGRGKINIQVVEIGTQIGKSNEEFHRVKIKLTPILTKDEIRTRLKENVGNRIWEKIEEVNIQGTSKELP